MDVDIEDADARSSQPVSDWSSSDRDGRSPTPGQQEPVSLVEEHVSSPDGQKPSQRGSISPSSHSQKGESSPLGPPPMSSYLQGEGPLSGGLVEEGQVGLQAPQFCVTRKVPPPKQPPQESMQSSGPERILVPASDTSMSQSQSQGVQEGTQPTKSVVGLFTFKREMEEGEMTWGQKTQVVVAQAQEAPTKQLARKTAYKAPVKVEKVNALSEDDEETNKGVFNGEGNDCDVGNVSPSREASGNAGVSKLMAPVTGVETRGQHEPETWKQPSFMKRKGRVKLGGFTAQLTGLRKGDGERMAWISWTELQRVLQAT